jgi:hypothetical protein
MTCDISEDVLRIINQTVTSLVDEILNLSNRNDHK